MKAIFVERGNSFPNVGDYVSGSPCSPSSSAQLYRITGELGPIQTGGPRGNYCHCEVEPVDWEDCAESDEHPGWIELPCYRIAPESDPGDFYAAGYDGNVFYTRASAERAIVSLVSMRGEWDIPWVVVVQRDDGTHVWPFEEGEA